MYHINGQQTVPCHCHELDNFLTLFANLLSILKKNFIFCFPKIEIWFFFYSSTLSMFTTDKRYETGQQSPNNDNGGE